MKHITGCLACTKCSEKLYGEPVILGSQNPSQACVGEAVWTLDLDRAALRQSTHALDKAHGHSDSQLSLSWGETKCCGRNRQASPQEMAAVIFIAKLPARHIVGPTQSVVSCSPAPGHATLSSTPEPVRPSHLPGEGERAGVEGPCLQNTGDCLEVIRVADKVWTTPGWR